MNGTIAWSRRLPPRMPSVRFHLSAPEKLLLATLLPLGLVAVFVVPLGAGHDEESQMARVWEMSAWHFLPNEKLGTPEFPYPMLLREVSYRRQVLIRPVPPDFWSEYADLPIDGKDYYYGPVETRIVYSPPLLLPQALVMRYLGRRFDLPFLQVYYATRLAGLLAYAFLAWAAVRLIPFGKWTMAVVAASPLALFQASTVSADAISNGFGALFIGGSLAIGLRSDLRLRDVIGLWLLFAALFAAKANLAGLAVLPLLLLRPSSFRRRSDYILLVAGAAALLMVEVVGWSWIAYPRVRTAMMEGADPLAQGLHILANPLGWIGLVAQDLLRNGPAYLRGWIAGYGYNYWSVPSATYLFFLLALGASLIDRNTAALLSRRTRWTLVATFTVAYLVTALAFYVAFSPAGAATVSGMHGRYLFAPLIPLALSLAGIGTGATTWNRVAGASCALGLTTFVAGAALSYHVPCGTQIYQPGLCYQPYYKNWAPEERLSPPLTETTRLVQEIVPECRDMTQVRVWIVAAESPPSSAVAFVLRDPTKDLNLVDATIPVPDLPRSGWMAFDFPPQRESAGRLYFLQVAGRGATDVRVGYTSAPENPTVKLFEGDAESELDMFYQYGCLTGLERWLRAP